MPYTKGEKLSKEEEADLALDIRALALDQMAEGLLRLGVPQADIDAVRTKCEALDSDQPFLELFRKHRSFLR